jgi:hypothetical protein
VPGAVIGAAASIYAGKQAKKGAQAQADVANRALDYSTAPRRTQYGSYVGPASGFAPQSQSAGGGFLGGLFDRLRASRAPQEQLAFIDPSIREMRERSLANVPEYQSILRPQLDSTLSGLGQTRGRLDDLYGQTNDNAFLDPILQRLALQRGQLSRGLTDRGLGGSSFMANALGNFESAAAPGIAQARQQGIQARQGILGDIANTDVQSLSAAGQGVAQLQNLDNVYASVAGQNLQQELSALGLSQADIAGILGAGQQIGQAGQLRAASTGNTLAALGDIFSKINFGGGGTPYNPSAGQYGGIA